MSESDLDYLDTIAYEIRLGDTKKGVDRLGALSKGEAFYVALAADRADLFKHDSIAYMLKRVGSDWVSELIRRHQYD